MKTYDEVMAEFGTQSEELLIATGGEGSPKIESISVTTEFYSRMSCENISEPVWKFDIDGRVNGATINIDDNLPDGKSFELVITL